jgi:hypothetical protein
MSKQCCQHCKKESDSLTPRYVATKKKVLKICNGCCGTLVTYDPAEFIDEGVIDLTCE